MQTKELMRKRAQKLDSAETIRDSAKTAERDLTVDELDSINTLIDEADALEQQYATVVRLDEANTGRRAGYSGVRESVLDDPNVGFKTMGEFAAHVAAAYNPATKVVDERLRISAAATGMSQDIGSDGGFLVPPSFSTQIWDGLRMASDNLLDRTMNFTVEGESLTIPANGETSRATGSRWGGVQGFFLAEADQITNSKPTLRQVRLEPQELAVLVFVTDKLLRNAMALDAYVTQAATDEINFLTGDAIINGSGAGKPKGILSSASRVTVAAEAGQAAATIVFENINKMWQRFIANRRANAVWFINQDIEPQLEQLSIDVGTGGLPVYLPPGGVVDAPNARLKGRPVMPLEYCPTLGTEGDIILADLSAYLTGTKGAVNSASSMHLRFDFAETAFRFMFAVDGTPAIESPLTPFQGTDTLSPFVTLATRS